MSSVAQTNSVNTTSTTFVDIPGMVLVVSTNSTILLSYTLPLNSGTGCKTSIRVCDATETTIYLSSISVSPGTLNITNSQTAVITTLTPGNNTFKLQWALSGAGSVTSDGTSATRYLSVVPLN